MKGLKKPEPESKSKSKKGLFGKMKSILGGSSSNVTSPSYSPYGQPAAPPEVKKKLVTAQYIEISLRFPDNIQESQSQCVCFASWQPPRRCRYHDRRSLLLSRLWSGSVSRKQAPRSSNFFFFFNQEGLLWQ